MKSGNNILSRCQQDVKDLGFERIQRQDWVDWLERAFFELSEVSRVYKEEYTVTPAYGVNTITVPERVIALSQVYRNGKECREFSEVAVQNARRNIVSFHVNSSDLSTDPLGYSVRVNTDETVTLTFSIDFDGLQEVIIQYFSDVNTQPSVFTDTTQVPNWMENALYWTVLKHCHNALMQGSTGELYNLSERRAAKAERMSEKYIREASAYVRGLKSKSGRVQIQPYGGPF